MSGVIHKHRSWSLLATSAFSYISVNPLTSLGLPHQAYSSAHESRVEGQKGKEEEVNGIKMQSAILLCTQYIPFNGFHGLVEDVLSDCEARQ